MRAWTAIAAAAIVLSAARPSGATDFDLLDARSMGMGGAIRSIALSTSALYMNPAGITMTQAYHLETAYIFDDKYKMHMVGASVVDSVTSRLGMGLGYFFRWVGDGRESSKMQLHNLFLGLAYAIIPKLSVGVNMHYIRARMDYAQPGEIEPDAVVRPYGRALDAFSLDVGLTFHIIKNIGLAVVGYNLTHPNSAVAPTLLGLSAFARVAFVTVCFDVVLDFVSGRKLWDQDKPVAPRYMAGTEFFLGDHWPLRAGYSFSEVSTSHSVHGGVGYVGKKGSIEASMSYELNPGNDRERDFRLAISIRYFAF